ncbi:MAG: AIPR family protein [Anaerolineae bacterium]|nr:AIPR family protein [Anaerolineae bacterium]
MLPSQSIHRQTYLTLLNDEIRRQSYDNGVPFHTAATSVLMEWLDYDLDDVMFVHVKDRGIDAWVANEFNIEIFQFKTHDTNENDLMELSSFNSEGVKDLTRAKDFLLYEHGSNVSKNELKQLLQIRDSAIVSNKYHSLDDVITVTLHLVLLGEGLTFSAKSEFDTFQTSLQNIEYIHDVPIKILATLHTVDDIVDSKWREDNRSWVDITGRSYSTIDLTPAGDFISDNANAVFYCSAVDLVRAYEMLGYQLFEPNVRANIKHSRVNEAIRNSILHQKSRREFRFLNNGVTITSDSFTKPKGGRISFKVNHPGVVNGLQTVVALHTAYNKLSHADKEDFEKNCHVLVRVLNAQAVSDITSVVKATNNQNPMRPRNLVSNNAEQLTFVRLFSDKGWFYEAKQGAWDAFEKDAKRWRPNLNKRPKDFQGEGRKVRRIDNERLAQTWLSLIGFSPEAINRKKELFDEPYYSLIFKQQTTQHGTKYENISNASDEAINEAPNHYLLLISYIASEFARSATQPARQNRLDSCRRLGIDLEKTPRAEVDARLVQDDSYILNQALNGMSMLFTEFLGYVLYETLGSQFHILGPRLVSNHTIKNLALSGSFDSVKSIVDADFDPKDFLVFMWLAFVDTIQDMLSGGWGESYRAANIKVRFIFSKETRNLLYREVSNKNQFMKKRTLTKVWAIGVPEGQGLFDFVYNLCSE